MTRRHWRGPTTYTARVSIPYEKKPTLTNPTNIERYLHALLMLRPTTTIPRRIIRIDNRLRRHVIDGANLLLPMNIRRVVLNRLRDPEIDQFQHAADEEEVGRFQIGVHHPFFMDGIHRAQHLKRSESQINLQT